ncbi:hypothetical protein Tsubulata_012226 [Turnera subulata]|uniref:RRM domain-containing protein n=1 Tax=Turnera subulata TaxID=218843 RepID=A0A9Q0FIV4_9ROSI|nr:hypothetical protein Tsubulata_012226 [Turnera subulata]
MLSTDPTQPPATAPPQPRNTNNPTQPNIPDTTDPKKPSVPYFSKWSRQQVLKAMANGQVHSLYVQNMSPSWSPTDVYRIMSKYGEVVDVYIPRKAAESGQRFGFVRFKSNCDLQRLLSDVNRVQTENGVVQANIARDRTYSSPHHRTVTQRIGIQEKPVITRPFADVLRGDGEMDGATRTGISFIPTSDTSEWLSRCAVGVVKDTCKLDMVHLMWKLHDMPDVTVSELGGDAALVCFSSRDSMLSFCEEVPDWIPLWFDSFKPWQQGDRAKNRKCWLTIRGIPLTAWSNEFFNLVGSFFGKVVQIAPETVSRKVLGGARIQVLTENDRLLNREMSVRIAGVSYSVAVVEDPVIPDEIL